jgi:hypothetical protein
MIKQDRLIELLIKEIEAVYRSEVCTFGLTESEDKELSDLVSFYQNRINVEEKKRYPSEWNWAGFDYNKGYEDAEDKYLKIIKNKNEEIKKLTNENKTNRKD